MKHRWARAQWKIAVAPLILACLFAMMVYRVDSMSVPDEALLTAILAGGLVFAALFVVSEIFCLLVLALTAGIQATIGAREVRRWNRRQKGKQTR